MRTILLALVIVVGMSGCVEQKTIVDQPDQPDETEKKQLNVTIREVQVVEDYVGEYFGSYKSLYIYTTGTEKIWSKFKKSQIVDKVDCGNGCQKVKIESEKYFSKWVDCKDIIYYDDIYKPMREAIEKRHESEKKTPPLK